MLHHRSIITQWIIRIVVYLLIVLSLSADLFFSYADACISAEQFIAGLADRPDTAIFEGRIVSVIHHHQSSLTKPLTTGQKVLLVRVEKIERSTGLCRHFPDSTGQLTVGQLLTIDGIVPRKYDPTSCLPSLDEERRYVWIVQCMPGAGLKVRLHPGGVFETAAAATDRFDHMMQNDDRSDRTRSSSVNCGTQQCHYGATCDQWIDAGQSPVAVCVCPQTGQLAEQGKCFDDDSGQQAQSICATNGRLYENDCSMKRDSCLKQVDIESVVVYTIPHGETLKPEQCAQFAQNRKLSNRKTSGPTVDDPSQFNDQPQHDYAAKQTHQLVDEGHGGPPSWNLETHSSTMINCWSPITAIACPSNILRVACATDGKTYQNECVLQHLACAVYRQTGQIIERQHSGFCSDHSSRETKSSICPDGAVCLFGAKCVEKFNSAQRRLLNPQPHSNQQQQQQHQASFVCSCQDFACSNAGHFDTVCANNGQTYSNECALQKAACESQLHSVKLHYYGSCASNPCLNHKCRWHTEQCRIDVATGQPLCECPDKCPDVVAPVCASDGATYDSQCHLERSSCMAMRRDLWVVHSGQCTNNDACRAIGLHCQSFEICVLDQLRPPIVQPPTPGHQAKQPGGEIPQGELLSPTCQCPSCPEKGVGGSAVCGTDGQTYASECQLRVSACQRQMANIKVASVGPCAQCSGGCPQGLECINGRCLCQRQPCSLAGEIGQRAVCTLEGQLYASECEARRQACLTKRPFPGIDPTGRLCSQHHDTGVGGFGDQHSADAAVQSDQIRPSNCLCNPMGSLAGSIHCNARGTCDCIPGVTGSTCDTCPQGYTGLTDGQPCRPSIAAINFEPDSSRQQVEPAIGRQFTRQTTLLARLPFTLAADSIALRLRIAFADSSLDGHIVNFRAGRFPPPSRHQPVGQPVYNDDQFSLRLQDGRIELRYISASFPKRLYTVRTHAVTDHTQYMIETGVESSRPWIRLGIDENAPYTGGKDSSRLLTFRDVEQSWIPTSSTSGSPDYLYGGEGTMLIGSPTPDAHLYRDSKSGFIGCLSHLSVGVHSFNPPPTTTSNQQQRHEVSLQPGPTTPDLTWYGIASEAPACSRSSQDQQQQQQQLLQSDDVGAQRSSKEDQGDRDQHPCSLPDTCSRHGKCLESERHRSRLDQVDRWVEGFVCLCDPGWQGKLCEQEVTVIPHFGNNSFIQIPGPTGQFAMNKDRLIIELTFYSQELPGILFYIPPSQEGGSYIAAYLDELGFLTVSCRFFVRRQQQQSQPRYAKWRRRRRQTDLVSTTIFERYPRPIRINQWHSLKVVKLQRILVVRLDNGPAKQFRLTNRKARSRYTGEGRPVNFDVSKSSIYLGGFPFHLVRVPHLDIMSSLSGAIQKIKINSAELILAGLALYESVDLELLHRQPNSEIWNAIGQWNGPPCGPDYSPCQPSDLKGVCVPYDVDKAMCNCTTPLRLWQLAQESGARQHDDLPMIEQRACEEREKKLTAASLKPHSAQTDHDIRPQHDVPIQDQAPPEHQFTNNNNPYQDWMEKKSRLPTLYSNSKPTSQEAVMLDGNTVLDYGNIIQMHHHSSSTVRLAIRPQSPNGLILVNLQPQHDSRVGVSGYLATVLAVRQGRVELRVGSLTSVTGASGEAITSSSLKLESWILILSADEVKIDDGQWHTVQLMKSSNILTLFVDSNMATSELAHQDLSSTDVDDLHSITWLGGSMRSIEGLSDDYQQNFIGCADGLFVNEKRLSLVTGWSRMRGRSLVCT